MVYCGVRLNFNILKLVYKAPSEPRITSQKWRLVIEMILYVIMPQAVKSSGSWHGNVHNEGRCRRCYRLVKKNPRAVTLYKIYSMCMLHMNVMQLVLLELSLTEH